ncbi:MULTISPECIES: DEAD/DEAH box helicase [Mycobacterium]|uniref:Helicase SNF2 n=1 Tax=Mycobacterium paraffinicum TaxID=53378 RepID=A0A1Q4HP48_9MYCO|nr:MULTISPECIES: DEAD/DEAH box helicase [Mycobacterium]OCB20042.1 helicase SNF2 [Mycobacterium intracellulare subsp. yongonense]OJZ69466.1 helicase SNF2 [Mycobacterium paraffinicum]
MTARVVGQYRWAPEGVWEIEAEPDVMIRIKRIFPRVAATTRGTVTLTGTLEVARDLEWLTDRWPMKASVQDRQRLRAMAGEHRRAESAVQHVLSGGALSVDAGPGWVSPAVPLRGYQRTARDLVWATGGVLVADELGMGKTFTSLALLEQPQARPAIAVTLTGTMPKQWRRQLATFYPELTSVEVKTGPIHSLRRRGRTADLIVMSYSKLAKWQHHLKGVANTVIFDEVQELRRDQSDRYKAAMTVAREATYRVGLSATPIYNYGGEIYNVIDVLRPGALGDRHEFAREWCHTSGLDAKTQVYDPTALRSYLTSQGLLLRRTLDEVGIEVPPIIPIEQSVPSDPKVLSEIEGNAVALARLILDQSANPRERWTAAGQFDWMMRQHTGIAKAPFVADFVELLLQSEQRVILLGWHHAVHDIWAERLRPHRPAMYTGRETTTQKERSLDDFMAGRSRVLIMSLRSGAGIDGLQEVVNTLVFGELDWSPGVHKQAMGRPGRPGQTKPVRAYFATTDFGSDPVMLETLDIKTLQADALITGSGDGVGKPAPDRMTPERYAQIRRLAAHVVEQADQSPAVRRTA